MIQNPTLIDSETLVEFLKTTRPANSTSERNFIDTIINLIKDLGYEPTLDGFGNIIVNNLPTHAQSYVMFTSHTDSVHDKDTCGQTIIQQNKERPLLTLDPTHTTSNCLGADDATGVYVMLRLLQANIPALYVIFRAEEIGGLGSEFFLKDTANRALLNQLTHCISFDRKGYTSIITEQYNGRTASDEFASELSNKLRAIDPTLHLSADPTGSFTDSAQFITTISECTNLSVGYFNAHTPEESQDIEFIEILINALIQLDWLTLGHYRTLTAPPIQTRLEYKQSLGLL